MHKLTYGAVIIVSLVAPLLYGFLTSAPHRAELAFAEVSKNSSIVGSMVPASCSSSLSPNPQPYLYDYGPLGYLENMDWFHREPYVANCVCGNGATNFPTCNNNAPQVSVTFDDGRQPVIDSFYAQPQNISDGQQASLRWLSTNTRSCKGNWTSETLPTSGYKQVDYVRNPYGTTIDYTITCLGNNNITWTAPKTTSVTSEPYEVPCTNCDIQ